MNDDQHPRYPRARTIYVLFVTALAIVLLIGSDPDTRFIYSLPFGAGAVATLVLLFRAAIYNTFLHYTRKSFFDYIDLGDLYDIIIEKKDPVGAGLYMIGVAIFTLAFALLIFAAVK